MSEPIRNAAELHDISASDPDDDSNLNTPYVDWDGKMIDPDSEGTGVDSKTKST